MVKREAGFKKLGSVQASLLREYEENEVLRRPLFCMVHCGKILSKPFKDHGLNSCLGVCLIVAFALLESGDTVGDRNP